MPGFAISICSPFMWNREIVGDLVYSVFQCVPGVLSNFPQEKKTSVDVLSVRACRECWNTGTPVDNNQLELEHALEHGFSDPHRPAKGTGHRCTGSPPQRFP